MDFLRSGPFLVVLLWPALVPAQSTPCSTQEHRRFDFWTGAWSVSGIDGKNVGRSRIEKAASGCVLIEHWYGASGDRGKSFNWYDAGSRQWRQTYVGIDWNVNYTGQWRDGAMRFSGSQRFLTGQEGRVRLSLSPLEGRAVRQHKERLEGAQWVTMYDFRYTPDTSAAPFPPAAQSGCTAPESRQFDFWVGEWDVYDKERRRVGGNRIERVVNGCLLLENWTSARGDEGKSLNFFDTFRKEWRQIWVSSQGSLDLRGRFRDGVLRFSGQTPDARGGITLERLTFTANADGTVRQLWEQSRDNAAKWTVFFDGLYVRKGSPPPR